MKTSHLADGADALVRPAPGPDLDAFVAAYANDNRVPRGGRLPYARGVILAMSFDEDDAPIVSLHLLLPDGEIGVPFHTAAHDMDVIALWRGLGRDFNLPLYVRSEIGHLTAISPEIGMESFPRRLGSPLSGRRPRFLARRRMPLMGHALACEEAGDEDLQAELRAGETR
jgi:Family of unknown function (DUF6101)